MNKLECQICGFVAKSPRSLSTHIRCYHKDYSIKQYYDAFIREDSEGICSECDKETRFESMKQGYKKFCSKKCSANNKDVRNKCKSTNLDRYGNTNIFEVPEIIDFRNIMNR